MKPISLYKNNGLRIFLLILIIQVLFFNARSIAQPGTLDQSFGEEGKALGVGFGECTDMALQEDCKILLIGQLGDTISLGRFLPNGNLDSVFGNNGNQKIKINLGTPQLNLALLMDGRFMVAGTFREYLGNNQGDPVYNYDLLLMRFKKDGVLDSSFGENGKVKSNFSNEDFEYTMILQPDGKILVGGSASEGALLSRYLANGSLDQSFGIGGYRIFPAYDIINSLAVQEDGKIIAGSTNEDNFFNPKFRLVRYEVNGELDTTFGKKGIVISDFGEKGDRMSKIIIQKNGKILAAGNTNYSSISCHLHTVMYKEKIIAIAHNTID